MWKAKEAADRVDDRGSGDLPDLVGECEHTLLGEAHKVPAPSAPDLLADYATELIAVRGHCNLKHRSRMGDNLVEVYDEPIGTPDGLDGVGTDPHGCPGQEHGCKDNVQDGAL